VLTLQRKDGSLPFERNLIHRDAGDGADIPQAQRQRNRGTEVELESDGGPLRARPHLDTQEGAVAAQPPQRQGAPALGEPGCQREAATFGVRSRAEEAGDDLAQKTLGLAQGDGTDPAKIARPLQQLGEVRRIPVRQTGPRIGPDPRGVAADRPPERLVERGVGGVEQRGAVQWLRSAASCSSNSAFSRRWELSAS